MGDLSDLTSDLRALTCQFEAQQQQQPRPTRKALAISTRKIFQNYGKHGKSARLRKDVRDFLESGEGDIDAVDLTTAVKQPPDSSTKSPDKKGGARMVDLESAPFMHAPTPASMLHDNRDFGDGGLPFTFDKTFTISGDVQIPEGLLHSLSKILALYAAECSSLLRHHCGKYGPEALFRAGIHEWIESRTDHLFQHNNHDDLGLTPETRQILLSTFERKPELNLAEKRMLVRATRTNMETIEYFWEDMYDTRKTWFAMRQFIAARELEELRREKAA